MAQITAFIWAVLSLRQAAEMFHLVFLRALVAKGEDRALIALKGGCNLRFYFGSVRYSEDIDFDVVIIAKTTLKKRVEKLLASPLITAPLRSRGITLVDTSAPKQTETTQRWKVGLSVEGLAVPVRTKIEFARRDAIDGARFEATPTEAVRPYGLTPVLSTHYTRSAAIAQKIDALAGRTEPQARDVFDLALLFAHEPIDLDSSETQRASLDVAIDRATSLSFDEYASKVVAYLDPEQAAPHADRTAWEAMQEQVVDRLEALR